MQEQLRRPPVLVTLSIATILAGPAGLIAEHPPSSPRTVAVDRPVEGIRSAPAVAVSSDGRVLVVWEMADAFGSSRGLLGRIFEAGLVDPSPVFRVARAPAAEPAASWDPEGGFAVVWSSRESFPVGSSIRARRFHPDGSAKGRPILVTEGFAFLESVGVSSPRLAFLGGHWAAVWSVQTSDSRGASFESWLGARLIGAGGRLRGDEVTLYSEWGDNTDFQFELAADPVRRQAVVVVRRHGTDHQDDVVAIRYGLDAGVVSSTVVAVDPPLLGDSFGVAIDGKGRAAVVWAQRFRVRGRRVLAGGQPRRQGQVNPVEGETQSRPTVGVLESGHALVVWQRRAPREETTVQARWFDPADRVLGDAFPIAVPQDLEQRNPVAAADLDRGVVVAWEEPRSGGGGQVFLRYVVRP